ncbi:Ribonuclease H-like domain-containing protein [Cynara cardunculus var. scolymus]|uniref:Ribonuclease H-like domain-containing protein n=1 Tax=Cynara cardunculus var. scolymus TaxID=59895 RepID=A0A124SF58_CYNCS|nr:Ribonuclease H-like domain-containing protein [Cynara cardunculus var. scolymus]
MEVLKMANSRVSLLRHSFNSFLPPSPTSTFSLSILPTRRFIVSASISSKESLVDSISSSSQEAAIPSTDSANPNYRWKPMCLYYTQDKCTMMQDSTHLQKFNHSFSLKPALNAGGYKNKHSKHLDFFLVLDLEGKVEILEFPVLMIDAKTMDVVAFFHRVWHDTAIPFEEVIVQFEEWLAKHSLFSEELGGPLNRAAFVTCGNWDIKTKIPQQCQAAGMRTMMNELKIPMLGSHHLGIDDTKNIARVLQHMLTDGAVLKITARRDPRSPESVEFLFVNRIK